jgi:hypothetical protein
MASVIVPPVTYRPFPSYLSLLAALAAGLSFSHTVSAAETDEAESRDASTSDGPADADAETDSPSDDSAQDDEGKGEEKDAAPADEKDDDYGHMGQFGLRVGINGGLRMVLRYDESPFCREFDVEKSVKDQARFCGHMAPFAADIGLSFALLDWVEPFAWARLGFTAEEQTDTEPLLVFGAGLRIYTNSDSAFKIYFEPAVGLEFEKGRGSAGYQANNPEYKQDIVFHLAGGPQLDFSRYLGAYATFGVTTGVVRAIHSSLDAQLGVQGRYP